AVGLPVQARHERDGHVHRSQRGDGGGVAVLEVENVIPSAARDLLLAPRAADHPIGVASAARLLLLLSPRGAGARASRARLPISFCTRQRADPSSLRSSG